MDISAITNYLYVGARPPKEEAGQLGLLGVKLVISMLHDHFWKGVNPTLFSFLRLPTIDFPLTPIPVKTLYRGVLAADAVIKDGGKVLVYCKFGRHRSVAMASAILISQGFSAEEAMKLIDRQRPAADPYIFHIKRQILKFEKFWRNQKQA